MLGFEGLEVLKDFHRAQASNPMPRKTYADHVVYLSHNDFGTPRDIDDTPSLLLMCPHITDFGHAQKGDTDRPLVHPGQPDHCRAPEVILGLGWSYSADIWNLGAMIYDLLEGQALFSHILDASGRYSAKHHLAEMTQLLGPIPPDMFDKTKKGNARRWTPPVYNAHGKLSSTAYEYFEGPFYDEQGHLIHGNLDPPLPLTRSWKSTVPECIQDEEAEYTDFMKKMLCWSPEERGTAKELWDHVWLKML